MGVQREADNTDGVGRSTDLAQSLKSIALIFVVLGIGIVIGRSSLGATSAIAADPAPDATATRAAELKELNDLRTKVAQPIVCTPAPTATATSTPTPEPTATTVPPRPAGTEVIDKNGFAVTVLSIQPVQAPDGVNATGQLLRLNVTLSNTTNAPMLTPFVDWRLVDVAGNRYPVDLDATPAIAGVGWAVAVGANEKVERAVVFDVAPSAGTTFILENEKDPTFRIEVSIESRG